MNNIELKPIKDIQTYDFYIPSYQRGYRWTELQVRDLLEDLWEFSQKDRKQDEFYCLQPIVVKRNSNNLWDVIDGQQRLTTLFIILTYINKNILPIASQKYTLEFETRKGSEDFLKNIDEARKDENIDYYHIVNTYQVADRWFREGDIATRGIKLYDIILNNTKFIWYEIKENVDPIEIFTRINLGKIPLTNAELIKALFLKKDNFGENEEFEKINLRQVEISKEWDQMEYALQRDEFWFFLNNNTPQNQYQTRIEFIFNIMAKEKNNLYKYGLELKGNPYFSFGVFNRLFQANKDKKDYINELWREVRSYYLTFEEWYKDRELYHLIGFLIAIGEPIEKIMSKVYKKSKRQVKDELRYLIRSKVSIDGDLKELTYGDKKSNKEIKEILMLFNVITINRNNKSNMRFPFSIVKNKEWDIEHIHAVNSEMPNDVKQRKEWVALAKKELEGEKIIKDIDTFIIKNYFDDGERFEKLYNKISNSYSDKSDINDISNLAILDSGTNRALKNAIFPIKRKGVIERTKNGEFIPLCTQNVFLKYYSKDISQMYFWSEKDRADYLAEIKNTLKEYIG